MNSIMHEEVRELAEWKAEADILSIYSAMQPLKDTRRT